MRVAPTGNENIIKMGVGVKVRGRGLDLETKVYRVKKSFKRRSSRKMSENRFISFVAG